MQEIVVVGFTCHACHRRVPVVRSCEKPPKLDHHIVAQCECGLIRPIPLDKIQELEIWTEVKSEAKSAD